MERLLSRPSEKNVEKEVSDRDVIFRETRPESLLDPLPQPRKIFIETCVIINYQFDAERNTYVLNLTTSFGYRLSLIPNPYYINETKEPWKLEKNYRRKITYSGDNDSYGQIQTMTRCEWLYPKFFKNFAFL